MATQKQVVYPNTSSFSGTAQLNEGPFNIPTVNKLLRAEVRGKVNFQGVVIASTGVEANFQVWGLQWVPQGNAALDVVTSGDDNHWLIREQLGSQESRVEWTPSTNSAVYLAGYAMHEDWAGQLPIGASIDLYLSLRAPTGVSISNMNLFATLRWWWA